ncbi:MAG: hypothetical protein HY723_00120 [Chloroflexi bacterium]|nr:hypothetical protein [Chloroflexota bacterium]
MSKRKRRQHHTRSWEASGGSPSSETTAARQPQRGRRLALIGAALLAVAIPVAALAGFLLLAPGTDETPDTPRAVIVDQLGLTFPNPGFVQRATGLLEQAGYQVDYVPGEQATVSLYSTLASRSYDYVLLRVHTAQFTKEWRGLPHDEAVLFTSEPYSPEIYLYEQWELLLSQAYAYEGAPRYFGVAANFVESAMPGDFDGATVIMMGCGGLYTDRTAEAFMQRGAGVVLGWDQLVSANHTDRATERLLEKLLVDGLPIDAALAQTMAEVGRDPAYQSTLLTYPTED